MREAQKEVQQRLVSDAYYSDISSDSEHFTDSEPQNVDKRKLEVANVEKNDGAPAQAICDELQLSESDSSRSSSEKVSDGEGGELIKEEPKSKDASGFKCPWATEEEFLAFVETIPAVAGRYTDADPDFRDDKDPKKPPVRLLFRRKVDQRPEREKERSRGVHRHRRRQDLHNKKLHHDNKRRHERSQRVKEARKGSSHGNDCQGRHDKGHRRAGGQNDEKSQRDGEADKWKALNELWGAPSPASSVEPNRIQQTGLLQ